jgi:hypothetical protein
MGGRMAFRKNLAWFRRVAKCFRIRWVFVLFNQVDLPQYRFLNKNEKNGRVKKKKKNSPGQRVGGGG